MRIFFRAWAVACVVCGCCSCDNDAQAGEWRQWRGPHATGSVTAKDEGAGPPTSWSATQNIGWKVPIPGKGHSTPIVIGNRVFLTTSTPVGESLPPKMSGRPGEHDNLPITSRIRFSVICLDRQNGALLWNKTANEVIPLEAGHITASLASASPVADDRFVFAMFGSHGLFCFDHEGNLVWNKELGKMHTKHGHGEGATPVLHGDTLVVNWDHEEQSFIVAFNRLNGREIWRQNRPEDTSWSSPTIAEVDGKTQVIVCGTNRIRGYDLLSGEVIWECGGLSSNIVATPIYDSTTGILVAGSSYEIRKMMAIQVSKARGDITDSQHVLWSRTRGTPYVPSPLLTGGKVYFLTHYQNVMTGVNIVDGKESPGTLRLGELGNIYASPVSDGRNIFVTDLQGTTMVLTAGEHPELVSINMLEEPVSASLALAGSELFIRGKNHLFCIRK